MLMLCDTRLVQQHPRLARLFRENRDSARLAQRLYALCIVVISNPSRLKPVYAHTHTYIHSHKKERYRNSERTIREKTSSPAEA